MKKSQLESMTAVELLQKIKDDKRFKEIKKIRILLTIGDISASSEIEIDDMVDISILGVEPFNQVIIKCLETFLSDESDIIPHGGERV